MVVDSLIEIGGHALIAVIFELLPHQNQKDPYLELAAQLRPHLEQIDGFLSIERFESLSHPGKLLSLSFWRDEAAVMAWRQQQAHREAQTKGRSMIFKDYRLRVASVMRDYGMSDRDQAPLDSRRVHETQRAPDTRR